MQSIPASVFFFIATKLRAQAGRPDMHPPVVSGHGKMACVTTDIDRIETGTPVYPTQDLLLMESCLKRPHWGGQGVPLSCNVRLLPTPGASWGASRHIARFDGPIHVCFNMGPSDRKPRNMEELNTRKGNQWGRMKRE